MNTATPVGLTAAEPTLDSSVDFYFRLALDYSLRAAFMHKEMRRTMRDALRGLLSRASVDAESTADKKWRTFTRCSPSMREVIL